MIKVLIVWFVRKYKNPSFEFDNHVSTLFVFSLLIQRLKARIRGLKLLFYFKRPNGLFLGNNVQFNYLWNIHIGKLNTMGNCVFLSGLGKGGIVLGDRVSLGDFSRVIVSTSFDNIGEKIVICNDVAIGEFAYIGGAGGVLIGESCIIGQYFSVHPENHIYADLHADIRFQGVQRKGISVGSNCWIGSKVTILDGVTLGSGCVIAAGSVVNKSFPNNSIVGGVPAKLLKHR